MNSVKEVLLIKLPTGKFCLVPVEEFFVNDDFTVNDDDREICRIIHEEDHNGWWVYDKTIKGGASDFISDEVIVTEFSDEIASKILKNGGKCFVEVDYKYNLRTPKNGRGKSKVLIYMERLEDTEEDTSITISKQKS